MKLPDDVKTIRAAWISAKGLPSRNGPESDELWEDRLRKEWTIPLCEQVAFQIPGQGWGVKRADPGRPIGKDSIARQVDGRLLVWDLLTGAGTGRPSLNDDPESEDITGQFFETRGEFFQPSNHLGATGAPVSTSPASAGSAAPQGSGPGLPDALASFIQDVRASLGRIEADLRILKDK